MAKLISLALAFILSCITVFPAASSTSPLEYLLRSDKSKPNSKFQSQPLSIPLNGTTIHPVTQLKTSETSFSEFSFLMSNPSVSITGWALPPGYIPPGLSILSIHPKPTTIISHQNCHRMLWSISPLGPPIIHSQHGYHNSCKNINHTMSLPYLEVIVLSM